MEKLIISQVISDRAMLDLEQLIREIEIEEGSFIQKCVKKGITKAQNIKVNTVNGDMINEHTSYYLVKDRHAKLIGYFSFFIFQEDISLHKFCLTKICFKPEHRGKRYGSRVLKYIGNLAVDKECQWVSAYIDNKDSRVINFFDKNGFCKDPELIKEDEKGLEYCCMEKSLVEIYYKKLKGQRV